MGGGESAPKQLENIQARLAFDNFVQAVNTLPEDSRNSKKFRRLVRVVHNSLKRIPPQAVEVGICVSGSGTGPLMVSLLPKFSIPPTATKISFRRSGLTPSDVPEIVRFLKNAQWLREFDISENKLGDSASSILCAAVAHPSLTGLLMESCNITDKCVEDVITLVTYNRRLETLRLRPFDVKQDAMFRVRNAVFSNRQLRSISMSKAIDFAIDKAVARNECAWDLMDEISRSPWNANYRGKTADTFKSIKGREMIMGRAKQKQKVRGTDLFEQMEEADKKAQTIENQNQVVNIDVVRSGHAEMMGRRTEMNDVSIIVKNMPTEGAHMFALFDGHGGREGSDFVAENLPNAVKNHVSKGLPLLDAFTAAFKELQDEMEGWCVYVGTTAAVAVVQGQTLSTASVGDSRIVLNRGGTAIQLSMDHKPSDPDEREYIEAHGGTIQEGRLGGLLAVSRALGDAFFGEAVRHAPDVKQLELEPEDTMLILACDGVWDVMSNQDAVDLIASEIDPLKAAKMIRDRAFELESKDNISVVVVFLGEGRGEE